MPEPEGMEEGSVQELVSAAQRATDRMPKRPGISVGWLLVRRRFIFRTVKESSSKIFERQFTESAVGPGDGVTEGSPMPGPVGAGKRVDVGFKEECFAPSPFMGRSPAW
jgi:hypothetical protein